MLFSDPGKFDSSCLDFKNQHTVFHFIFYTHAENISTEGETVLRSSSGGCDEVQSDLKPVTFYAFRFSVGTFVNGEIF